MRVLCAAALLVGACDQYQTLHVELPPLEDARSAVFAIHAGGSFEARAAALDGPDLVVQVPVDLTADDSGRIEVLAYDEALSDLGLEPGVVSSVQGGTRRLQQTDIMYETSFDDGEVGAWRSFLQRSPELDAIRLATGEQCARFTVEASFELETAEDHGFVLPLGPEEAVVVQYDLVALVDANGATTVTDRPSQLPLADGFEREDGTYVFGGARGEVWSVRITTSTSGSPLRLEGEALTALPGGVAIVELVGGDESGTLELFALDREGGFSRFDGTSWTQLASFGVGTDAASGLARPRPGLAYAGVDGKAQVLRYVDGRVEEHSPPDLVNGVPGLDYLPGFGLVIALSEGGVYRLREDDVWETLGESPIALNVYAFALFQDGLIFGGAFGQLAQYKRSIGFCQENLLGAGFIKSIVPFGDGFLLGEDKPKSRDRAQVSILRVME